MRFLFVVVLLVIAQVRVQANEEEEEEAILASLEECTQKVKPSDDDLTEISKGELKSDTSKEVVSCWFKGAGVMQDKMFQKDKAVVFLRALTPGDPEKDNVGLMKKLAEKCDPLVNSQAKDAAAEVDAAVMIYDCLVREGRSMQLSLEEGNGNSTTKS